MYSCSLALQRSPCSRLRNPATYKDWSRTWEQTTSGKEESRPSDLLRQNCNIFTACHVRPLFYLSALPSILGLSFTSYGFSSLLWFNHFSSTVVTQYTFNTLEEKRFNLRTWTQVLELSRQLSRGVNWPPCSVALESTRTTECYSMLFIWFHMSFGSSPYLFGFCD